MAVVTKDLETFGARVGFVDALGPDMVRQIAIRDLLEVVGHAQCAVYGEPRVTFYEDAMSDQRWAVASVQATVEHEHLWAAVEPRYEDDPDRQCEICGKQVWDD